MNAFDIVNLQRKVKLDTSIFREFLKNLSKAVSEAGDSTFSVAFISDRRMRELNNLFRGKDSTTDVLSFPHEPDEFLSVPTAIAGKIPGSDDEEKANHGEHEIHGTNPKSEIPNPKSDDFLGDIVISAEQAQKQAEENGLTLENEIKQLILHGLLHLCGFDHETDDGEMNARELELRERLGI